LWQRARKNSSACPFFPIGLDVIGEAAVHSLPRRSEYLSQYTNTVSPPSDSLTYRHWVSNGLGSASPLADLSP